MASTAARMGRALDAILPQRFEGLYSALRSRSLTTRSWGSPGLLI
jgi:hypothetical protein